MLSNPKPIKRARTIQIRPMAQPMILAPSFSRRTGSKRPVDKLLINVLKTGVDGTQVTTTLVTATFPCTVVGLRWDISCIPNAGTGIASYAWAIIILRDGVTVSTMAISDGATLYAPEQDVMAFGRGGHPSAAFAQLQHYNGSTKTMRKLMGGDKLMFIYIGEATNTSTVEGCIQFFCKT